MPEFVAVYERIGADYRLPILMMADFMTYSPIGVYAGPATAENYLPALAKARARGNPIFDLQLETDWEQKDGIEAAYRAIFARVPEGMTYLTLHFNAPGDIELMAEEPHIRIGEYEFFRSPRGRALMDEFGLITIGMRQFRDRMRAA